MMIIVLRTENLPRSGSVGTCSNGSVGTCTNVDGRSLWYEGFGGDGLSGQQFRSSSFWELSFCVEDSVIHLLLVACLLVSFFISGKYDPLSFLV